MKPMTVQKGLSVVLPVDNVDTDQLIPARFMSRPRSEGYGDLLMHDLRRLSDGSEDPNFVLKRHPQASIIVGGRNFGSGSSREAAVYALIDAGIQVVIATSFGDIFSGNAVNNGLLPACIDAADHHRLSQYIGNDSRPMQVDVNQRMIKIDDLLIPFHLDDALHLKLINGWDDIDLTKLHTKQIAGFRDKLHKRLPWVWPNLVDSKPSSDG